MNEQKVGIQERTCGSTTDHSSPLAPSTACSEVGVEQTRLPYWRLAVRPDVVRRALTFAAVVGTILVLINHWDLLLGEPVTLKRISSILLTYCVPYTVTTLASVQAIRGERRGEA